LKRLLWRVPQRIGVYRIAGRSNSTGNLPASIMIKRAPFMYLLPPLFPQQAPEHVPQAPDHKVIERLILVVLKKRDLLRIRLDDRLEGGLDDVLGFVTEWS